jgi:alpha-1,6-mannosyltransferase
VDLGLFNPRRRAAAQETRHRYGIPSGPVALYAGRLAREKELHVVLEAWPRVEAATGAHLVIVGSGPSEQHFKQRCQAQRVTWLPYERDRERLADLFASADLYVAPGPAETFGLAAVEALASGTPVVSSDAGAVREIVEASGAGRVNPEPTAASMAATIIQQLEGDLAESGVRGRAYAEAHHAWSRTFDRMFAFYRSIIREHHVQ